jgi:tetratricopeptide (TPR) repeat protein
MKHWKALGPLLVSSALLGACGSAPPAAAPPAEGAHEHARTVTLAWLAETAIPLPDLGTLHRRVTTRSPEAQAFFDQGLRLLYAFNHDEATRSFAKAAALDPECGMCFWGVAITLGPNYNVPMLAERSVMAWEALQKATALAPRGTPVEQALIGALAKRYGGPEYRDPAAQQPYTEAYAAAMRDVARRFPDDVDVQVLFAESLMNIAPWQLWTLEGRPGPHTEETVATLEKALAMDERHPGANHYYIHAVEASSRPDRALPSADRLAGLMPGAGHIVHMPAHIYQRVGRYADASAHNRRAAEVDRAYMARIEPWGYYAMYLGHNHGFLSFSASMEGRSEESLSAAREAAKVMPPSMLDMMPGMDFFAAEPILAMVRFGKHDELLAEPRPEPRYKVMTGLWLHGHGMALAAKGRLDEARADLAELSRLAGTLGPEVRAGNNAARDVMNVAAKVLGARIAEKAGDPAALPLWAVAVSLADRLAYSEPNDWFYPVRHYHGAALIAADRYAEAEAVYRADLGKNPNNGWALFGLGQALRGQNRVKEAAEVDAAFQKAWARADIQLTSTAL